MKANILFVDIETSPILGYAWGLWDQNILHVLEQSKIISISWAWNDEPVQNLSLPDSPDYKPGIHEINDEGLVMVLWMLLDEADLVITQNGDDFDIKKMNARFVAYDMDKPSFYRTLDTKKVAKKYFRFDTNALDGMSKYLGIGKKLSTGGFELWLDCIAGDEKAWKKMTTYNDHDVTQLRKLYLRLRPFIENHPNMNAMNVAKGQVVVQACPACQSRDLEKRGFSTTQTGMKQRYRCNDCGIWSSGPIHRIKGLEIR